MIAHPVEQVPLNPLESALARVRLLVQRRALWLVELAKRVPNDSALPPALRSVLLDLDSPDQEAKFFEKDPRAKDLSTRAEKHARDALAAESPLAELAKTLRLDAREVDLLQVCLAAHLDPALGAAFAFAGGEPARRYPTEALAARLCGHGRAPMWSPSSALAQWELVVADSADPGEPVPLRVDPFVLAYLEGRVELDAALIRCATAVSARVPLPIWPVAEIREQISQALSRNVPTRIVLIGPPGSGRRTLAATVCRSIGVALLAIDTDAVADAEWVHIHRRAQRQALMHGCAIAWFGSRTALALREGLTRLPLELVIAEPPADLRSPSGWSDVRVEMPPLDSEQRAAVWLRELPVAHAWSAADRARIAERFSLQIGDIAHIAAQGITMVSDAERLAREATRGRLGDLATLIDCPFKRDDLQLPEKLGAQLDELLFEARERVRFWENESARRLFPRGTGLIALLSGAPGTGKTMAAQIVAAELGLDLFRIDLAATVSKYIGETAKNLRRLFSRAADMSAVLLFDEADALFSKRTDVRDAHDRHANADTNYLLQLVEDYPGIAMLATNRRQNMDEAFIRRIRYLLYFPRPERTQRRAIWSGIVRQLAGDDQAQLLRAELDRLADNVEATGAQIKNAVLGAAFFAREEKKPMAIAHLLRGLERELANQGRTLSESAAERVAKEHP